MALSISIFMDIYWRFRFLLILDMLINLLTRDRILFLLLDLLFNQFLFLLIKKQPKLGKLFLSFFLFLNLLLLKLIIKFINLTFKLFFLNAYRIIDIVCLFLNGRIFFIWILIKVLIVFNLLFHINWLLFYLLFLFYIIHLTALFYYHFFFFVF